MAIVVWRGVAARYGSDKTGGEAVRIYISGPISGDPDYKSNFLAAETMLRRRGYETINPGKLYLVANGLEHRQYMKVCMKLLKYADAIYMLNDFERSEGAMKEFNRAHMLPNIRLIWRESDGLPPKIYDKKIQEE